MAEKQAVGSIGWLDLTVEDADKLRDFYSSVVGWEPVPEDMEGYSDYSMVRPGTDHRVSGVCHSRGMNSGVPPVWIPYFVVADLDASIAKAEELGAEVFEVRRMGTGGLAYLRDPAGAVCAIWQD